MSAAGKRKAESEEDREESPTLPVKASPPADTPPTVEESSTPAGEWMWSSALLYLLCLSALKLVTFYSHLSCRLFQPLLVFTFCICRQKVRCWCFSFTAWFHFICTLYSTDKPEAASQVTPALSVSAPPCAPTLSITSRQHSDSKPPQAIVKPQILTHIIEGFVIQEGAEPFPVSY